MWNQKKIERVWAVEVRGANCTCTGGGSGGAAAKPAANMAEAATEHRARSIAHSTTAASSAGNLIFTCADQSAFDQPQAFTHSCESGTRDEVCASKYTSANAPPIKLVTASIM